MGRIDLGISPLLKSCMKLCQKLPADTLDSWKRQTAFRIVLPITLLLLRSGFESRSPHNPQSTEAESLNFFLLGFFVISCSFPSSLRKPHRDWNVVTHLYPNRATAPDNCICAVGKSLKYTKIHRSTYSREFSALVIRHPNMYLYLQIALLAGTFSDF